MTPTRDMREHRPTAQELGAYLTEQARRRDLPPEVRDPLADAALACLLADVPRPRRSDGGDA